MGEYADMMLEGDVCGTCGEYMDGEGDGIPRYCSAACDPFESGDAGSFAGPKPKKKAGKRTLEQELQRAVDRCLQATEDAAGGRLTDKKYRRELGKKIREIISPTICIARIGHATE